VNKPHRTPSATDHTILVIDDEPDLRVLYELTLLREGYRVESAGTVAEAFDQLDQHPFSAVISDMRLPDGSGLQVLERLRMLSRPERCVVMTAYGSADNAVEALKAGAFDYLTKPVDLKQFRAVVASAIRSRLDAAIEPVAAALNGMGPHGSSMLLPESMPAANALTSGETASKSKSNDAGARALASMVGDSEVMRAVKKRIERVARSMAPVLIRGESGTGKELVARAVHANSHRAAGPLVAVNCGAIPEALLEAEFFGAGKGSYTGATQDRDGYFQAARGGTLFLDEIGDLPLAMQSKLLRAIQERKVRPLGSTHEEEVDVRILSATHRDLASDVQSGRFRQDLFYRLNVIEIVVPALRERRDDLPALCAALLARIAHESGMDAPALSPETLRQLAAQPLNGNVRELENLLHRAVALSEGASLQIDASLDQANAISKPEATISVPATGLPATALEPEAAASTFMASTTEGAGLPSDLQAYLDAREREILVRALRENGFNRTAAAAKLGISLRQIRYRIDRLQIAAPKEGPISGDAD
jgi:two-component system response regulator PilR (NtrC family)